MEKRQAGQQGQKGQAGQSSATGDQLHVIADLRAQIAQLTEVAARAQADLQNAKMRMGKDADELRRFASQTVMLKLLPVIDNFQRAFTHLPEELKTHEWVKGIAAVEQDLMKVVAEMGLKRFAAIGEQVDTARHEVLTIGPGKEGEILEVFEEGYELNGRVIRPAKVKVGDGTEGKEGK